MISNSEGALEKAGNLIPKNSTLKAAMDSSKIRVRVANSRMFTVITHATFLKSVINDSFGLFCNLWGINAFAAAIVIIVNDVAAEKRTEGLILLFPGKKTKKTKV